jgi:hypothetical protein
MARGDTQQLILWGVLGYAGYRLALSGSLGASAQKFVTKLKTGASTPTSPAPSGPGYTPGPAPAPGSRLEQCIAQNPNFYYQMREWQQARLWNGEDWNDWNAFKAHLVAIGAPNPGDPAPAEFYNSGLT